MNSTLKAKLFTKWHTMRWIALFIGVFLAVMAIWYQDIFSGFLSAFFVFQAVTNSGCMVSPSCQVSPQPQKRDFQSGEEPETNYTEIK